MTQLDSLGAARARPLVAIVGSGFSGLMAALHLLQADDGPSVMLIDRRSPFGLGAAYSTPNPLHLLNVRAGNMSAWPDRPTDFVEWLAKDRGLSVGPEMFASRGEYGRYLQQMLARVSQDPSCRDRLHIVPDEVVSITPQKDGWRMELGVGRSYFVDGVVLASGNPPPAQLQVLSPRARASAAYADNPWTWTAPKSLAGDGPILVVGSGLTMVDVVLTLTAQFPDRRVIALSRRGLAPLSHEGPPPLVMPDPPVAGSPLQMMVWLRASAARVGWRCAIDAIRPVTQTLWSGWTLKQKAQFLRHARPWWDVHRHRLGPEVAERLAGLCKSGRLSLAKGRLLSIDLAPDGFAVEWRGRGERHASHLTACAVINCTGSAPPFNAKGGELIDQMRREGLLRADALGLGVDADRDGRLIGRDGAYQRRLYAIGPVIRGALWEIIAVPDIRNQAPRLAQALLSDLKVRTQV